MQAIGKMYIVNRSLFSNDIHHLYHLLLILLLIGIHILVIGHMDTGQLKWIYHEFFTVNNLFCVFLIIFIKLILSTNK